MNLQPLVVQLGDEVAVVGRVANALPPDAGVIQIMDADNLTLAQDITNILNTVGLWLWVVPILLLGLLSRSCPAAGASSCARSPSRPS